MGRMQNQACGLRPGQLFTVIRQVAPLNCAPGDEVCRRRLPWRLGVVASVVHRMNEVTLRRARLVLGWVTVFGRVYHHGV